MNDAPIFTLEEVYWTVAACAPLLILVGIEIGRIIGKHEVWKKRAAEFKASTEYVPPVKRPVFLGGSRFVFARDEHGKIVGYARDPRGHSRN